VWKPDYGGLLLVYSYFVEHFVSIFCQQELRPAGNPILNQPKMIYGPSSDKKCQKTLENQKIETRIFLSAGRDFYC